MWLWLKEHELLTSTVNWHNQADLFPLEKEYGDVKMSKARLLKLLEWEISRLRKIVADLSLDK